MNENDSKLADLAQTIDEALRLKKLNEELLDNLASSIQWILHYTAKYDIPLPDQKGLEYLVRKTSKLLREIDPVNASPETDRRKPSPEDLTEPAEPP